MITWLQVLIIMYYFININSTVSFQRWSLIIVSNFPNTNLMLDHHKPHKARHCYNLEDDIPEVILQEEQEISWCWCQERLHVRSSVRSAPETGNPCSSWARHSGQLLEGLCAHACRLWRRSKVWKQAWLLFQVLKSVGEHLQVVWVTLVRIWQSNSVQLCSL